MKRMRKFFTTIVVVIILSLTMTLSGCGFGNVKTDDEIYKALEKATMDLFDYKDELTIKFEIDVEENGEQVESIEVVYSINPSEGQMYGVLNSNEATVKTKIFKAENKSYIMTATKLKKESDGSSTTYEKEQYYVLSKENVKKWTSFMGFSALSSYDIQTIFNDYSYSFTDTKAAYENVYAEQVEERLKVDDKAYAECRMNTEKSWGTISFNGYKLIRKSDVSPRDGFGTYTITEKEKIVGKNGKVTQLIAEQELSFLKSTIGAVEKKEKTVMQMDIDYSFDEKGYKNIETNLSQNVEAYPEPEVYAMKFNIGGLITEKTTETYSFNSNNIFSTLTRDFRKSGCVIEWYEDPEYTKSFDAKGLTYDKFFDIKCIYGKLTVEDGYAIIGRDYRMVDERTDAYKAVFGPVYEESATYEIFESKRVEDEPTYILPLESGYKHSVNGKQYDETSNTLALERGKFYIVETAKSVTNERYSIFDIDVSSLWVIGGV